MNKKFAVALLLPVLLIPLASFAYAHAYDYVEKKYKMYIGKMEANVTYFHVDYVRLIDQNNDGNLLGDEVNVTVWEDNCKWIVNITVNPVTPMFVLNTTMHIQNTGEIPWEVTWAGWPKWDNGTADPCWDTEPTKPLDPDSMPGGPISTLWPDALWSWDIEYYKWNGTCYTADPTEHKYKPGDKLIIKQHINLEQPSSPSEIALYKKIQGSWYWIWEKFEFESEDPITDSCETFGDDQGIVCP